MSAGTGYAPGGAVGGMGGGTPAPAPSDYWSLERCKRAYLDYLGSKRDEIEEQKTARRYRHGAHWTAAAVKALKERKQPVVTYNRIGRKIDGVVGLVEKLRQDPKAYPRTPKHEEGAELATAVLRYCLDEQDWKATSPLCAEDGATDGLGGIEITIERGDQGDPEIGLAHIDPEGYFYDPRSVKLDFSDARYQGLGKWLDADTAKDMFPDSAAEIDAALDDGAELTSNPDHDNKWFQADGDTKRIRLVDIWYRHKGEWCWCVFTGSAKLMEGRSYLTDEKNKTFCKYIMFSANVDHDGDRYGFVRNLKSANDEINQRRSKGLHELNTRRIIGEIGAFPNVEEARREAARPDGMVLRNKGFEAEFDDTARAANIEGQLKFLHEAKDEIENFGPNPAILGNGLENASGRAIKLLQEAGLAELGPFILSYRGWKIRVYRAIWNAVRGHWTAERWIRVTDDEGLAQFVQINGVAVDPATGAPTLVNAIGALDVDIILDEGPDHVNAMADVYDTLQQIVPAVAAELSPGQKQAMIELLVDTSPLPASAKKRFRDASKPSQPDPVQQQAQELELQGRLAEVRDRNASAGLKQAQTQKTLIEANLAPAVAAHEVQARTADQALEAERTAADARGQMIDGMHADADRAHEAQENHLDRLFQADQAERAHQAAAEQVAAASGTPAQGA